MPTLIKRSNAFGLILIVLGCFLPWQAEGIFLYYWKFGVRLFPTFDDNGGIMVLILCVAQAFLLFKPPTFVDEIPKRAIAISAVLVMDSVIQICFVLIERSKAGGIIGAPTIQIGLIMVFIGSVILLFTSLLYFRKLSH